MKEFVLVSDFAQIAEVLQTAGEHKLLAVIWQSASAPGLRKVQKAHLYDVDADLRAFGVSSHKDQLINVDGGDIFFYLPFMACIFRARQTRSMDGGVACTFPLDMKILDAEDDQRIQQGLDLDLSQENNKSVLVQGKRFEKEDFFKLASTREVITTVWKSYKPESQNDNKIFEQQLGHLTLDEEDKVFDSVRVAPRARAQVKKIVELSQFDGGAPAGRYEIFDLSRSGMAFITDDVNAVGLKSVLKVMAIDQNRFDNPMVIQVMNIRPMDDNPKQFKVGCRFLG